MDAYIVAGYRTAVGKSPQRRLVLRPDSLAADVIKHLVKIRSGLGKQNGG